MRSGVGIASRIIRPDMVYRTADVRPANASRNIGQQIYAIAADFTKDPKKVAEQYGQKLGGQE